MHCLTCQRRRQIRSQSTKLNRCQYPEHNASVSRFASPGLQTLQEICYSRICKMIMNFCWNRLEVNLNFDENKRAMRQFFSQLPVTVREEILEKISCEYPYANYPFHLYLDEVLFSMGMRKLKFKVGWNCRQNHIDSFFNLVLVEGKGLSTLKFDCMSYDRIQFHVTPSIYEQLKQIFVSAEHLVDLTLTYICDDTIMKIIGENCTRLQKLDLSHGRMITAKGIHYLTQNFVQHPTETEEGNRVWESTRWEFPGIFPPLEELLPEGEPVKFYERKKSPLCSTLKFINIDFILLSNIEPVLVLTELIPGIESLGPWMTSNFLTEIWKKWFKLEKGNYEFLNLTSIAFEEMEEPVYDMIITLCPKLRHVRCSYFKPSTSSTFSLSSFNHFPNLESLEISHSNFILHTERFGDLTEEIRGNLTTVSIENPRAEKPFDVSDIHSCSELRRLSLKFPHISWRGGSLMPPRDTMEKLCFVDLRGKVTGKTVLSILECAPNLEYLMVWDITERSQDFLQRILGIRELPKLETFKVLEGFLLDTADELRSFLSHFEKIQHVGKVRYLSNY